MTICKSRTPIAPPVSPTFINILENEYKKKETHRHLHEVKSIRFFFANISQSNAMTNVKNNLFQSETHV